MFPRFYRKTKAKEGAPIAGLGARFEFAYKHEENIELENCRREGHSEKSRGMSRRSFWESNSLSFAMCSNNLPTNREKTIPQHGLAIFQTNCITSDFQDRP